MVRISRPCKSRKPVDVVQDALVARVVEEPVDGEIAAARIVEGGAEVVVFEHEEIRLRFVLCFRRRQLALRYSARARRRLLDVGRRGPKRRDLEHPAALEKHLDEPEASPDEAAIPKQIPHLFRRGARRDVEVLRNPAKEQVAHATADEIRLVPLGAEARNYPEGIGVELLTGNRREAVRCLFAHFSYQFFFPPGFISSMSSR